VVAEQLELYGPSMIGRGPELASTDVAALEPQDASEE
jgi:hypothetical protein